MSKLITALIVDDEQDARDGLERLINNEIPEINIIGKSENAQNALEMIIDKQPDLLFLDIQMPVNDGFWLAEKLSKLNNSTCIIFVTAYDEYAIEAFKHAAFDFITKPIIPATLKKTVTRFLENKNNFNLKQKLENLSSFFKQDRLKFNTLNGFIMLTPVDIIYCEADKNYTNVFLANGKSMLITLQLGFLEEKLSKKSFVRIGRSTLINLDYLEDFNRKTKTVVLSDVLQKYEFKVSSSGVKKLIGL